MPPPPPDDGFPSNPFALASILQAAESRQIVAARDIVDDRGVKLWAANLRLAPGLHQRLIARKLRHPLETSLRVEDGVSHDDLVRELHRFVDGPEPLARFVAPLAARLTPAVATLPLPPVVQLLLTTAQQLQPAAFAHAVRAMALAGALTCALTPPAGAATAAGAANTANTANAAGATALSHALQAGLLHDIGELYLNPSYQGLQRPLQPAEFRHLAAHPQMGALLLRTLADAPAAVCQAVAEHHERLDGSGYPAQLGASQLGPLGQLIAVVEVALGLAAGTPSDGTATTAAHFAQRLGLVLRFVGGELNHALYGPLVRWSQGLAAERPAAPAPAADADAAALAAVADLLDRLLREADALAQQAEPHVARVAQRARHRIGRLRGAGHAMGLWMPPELADQALAADGDDDRLLQHLARQELRHRLQTLQRDCLWPETEPAVLADPSLARLWQPVDAWLAASLPAAGPG